MQERMIYKEKIKIMINDVVRKNKEQKEGNKNNFERGKA